MVGTKKSEGIMKRLKRILFILLIATLVGAVCNARGGAEYRIIHEVDTVWKFGIKGVNLFSRNMHRIDIAYPSIDVDGSDIELSGYVCIPGEIYDEGQPVDGILLYNHYTQLSHNHAPTRGYAYGEDLAMANPLKPNYIVVCSDFIGFGLTENRPQVYCFNDINGQSNIDCLIAARKLLDDRNISQGKFIINAGYSSGGFDAIATQRVRDMKYRDQITFHKTVCGGMPFDIMKAYDKSIEWKNDSTIDASCQPFVLAMYNLHANMGYTKEQMFKEPFASKFDEWFMSGKYDNESVLDSMKGIKLVDIMQDVFLDNKSDEYKRFKSAVNANSLKNGWTPDTTQRYYVSHVLRDNIVPIESGRPFLYFLSNFRYNGKTFDGFKRSIVPERTHLQTFYLLPTSSHTIVGGLTFYLNLAATLAATPVLYYDGELNTHYADVVEPVTLMGIIRMLEEKGYDVCGAVQKLMAGSSMSGGGFLDMLMTLEDKFRTMGTSTVEVLEVLEDNGLELMDILNVYTYLTTPKAEVKTRSLSQDDGQELFSVSLTDYYYNKLDNWLKDNNVNLFDDFQTSNNYSYEK